MARRNRIAFPPPSATFARRPTALPPTEAPRGKRREHSLRGEFAVCVAWEHKRRTRGALVQVDVAVLGADDDVLAGGEVAADAVGDGDRAVAAAGAADRD